MLCLNYVILSVVPLQKYLGSDKLLFLRMHFWSVCSMLMTQKISEVFSTFSSIK